MAFRLFKVEAGGYATQFRTNCDLNLLGSKIQQWLIDNDSDIHGAPSGRKSSNDLIEQHWQMMLQMARAYITDAHIPKSFGTIQLHTRRA
jgi:hypothetical protein